MPLSWDITDSSRSSMPSTRFSIPSFSLSLGLLRDAPSAWSFGRCCVFEGVVDDSEPDRGDESGLFENQRERRLKKAMMVNVHDSVQSFLQYRQPSGPRPSMRGGLLALGHSHWQLFSTLYRYHVLASLLDLQILTRPLPTIPHSEQAIGPTGPTPENHGIRKRRTSSNDQVSFVVW